MISQLLIVLQIFNALFTFTLCVISVYLTVSLIHSNLLVKIKCSC